MEAFRGIKDAKQQGQFFFMLSKGLPGVRLSAVDRRGRPANPDFRRFASLQRDAVREFSHHFETRKRFISWGVSVSEEDRSIADPDPRLLDIAAASGLLVGEDMSSIAPVDDERRLRLDLALDAGGRVAARLCLDEMDKAEDESRLFVASPRHAVARGRLYSIRDIGPAWLDAGSLLVSIPENEIEVFLSLALSRFSGLDVRLEGYETIDSPARVARPALVFSEVDTYGFLHIRPVSSLEGYPPGFFEDHEISRVVELESAERRLSVSEVLFPTFAEDEFRRLLQAFGREDRRQIFEESGRFILAPEFAQRFLSERMPDLMASFALFEAQNLRRFKITVARLRLKLSVSSGIDFLQGEAQADIEGELFSYVRLLKEYRKQSFVSLSDGSRAYLDSEEMARFERLVHPAPGGEEVRISFFDYPSLVRGSDVEASGEAWKRPEAFYRGYNSIKDRSWGGSVAEGSLRSYQEFGVRWMDYLREHGLSGCLADEMGLGKTIQTIALLRRLYAEGERQPSLVVMPRSLLFNWEAELQRFAPELRRAIYYGTGRDTAGFAGAQVLLTSYAVLRIDVELLAGIEFCYLVLDESQMIKNVETKTTGAVNSLKARHRLALSGTPVENNLGELYSLFAFLNPGMFGSRAAFKRDYLCPIQEEGSSGALRDLKARVYPFILRRLKRDVLPELPEKTEQLAYIELSDEHLAYYHRRRSELKRRIDDAIHGDGLAKSRFLILQALSELRRLASVPEAEGLNMGVSAKRDYLREAIAEVVGSGHKCLVFANYLAAVEAISEDLCALGIGNLVMTGATADRASLVRRFQEEPEAKVLVMTLKTGGLGLNLTAAEYVFIFEPWWNRSAESQAIDRTHRIGQRNPVFCYRLIAKDTIEERILQLQEQKTELVSALIASDSDAFKTLDENDIAYLLG